jgi:hypothetical protein
MAAPSYVFVARVSRVRRSDRFTTSGSGGLDTRRYWIAYGECLALKKLELRSPAAAKRKRG